MCRYWFGRSVDSLETNLIKVFDDGYSGHLLCVLEMVLPDRIFRNLNLCLFKLSLFSIIASLKLRIDSFQPLFDIHLPCVSYLPLAIIDPISNLFSSVNAILPFLFFKELCGFLLSLSLSFAKPSQVLTSVNTKMGQEDGYFRS